MRKPARSRRNDTGDHPTVAHQEAKRLWDRYGPKQLELMISAHWRNDVPRFTEGENTSIAAYLEEMLEDWILAHKNG